MKKIGSFISSFGPHGDHWLAGSILVVPVGLLLLAIFSPPMILFFKWWFHIWGINQ